MDAAYDAKRINETSREFGHVPITDKNRRGKEVIPMAPHEAERYKIRSSAERANSRLKEDFGANNVMVKGHGKVTQHLMFGVVVLFADQLPSSARLDYQRSENYIIVGELRPCGHNIYAKSAKWASKNWCVCLIDKNRQVNLCRTHSANHFARGSTETVFLPFRRQLQPFFV